MDDVILLENPRRRRRRATRRKATRRAAPRRRTTRRRRRRNPTTTVAAAPRRRRAPARRRPATRRRRRRNPFAIGGGFSLRRAMGVARSATGFVAAEFLGDMLARAVIQKTPAVSWLGKVGVSAGMAQPWVQVLAGLFLGPTLRRFLPRTVSQHWEMANVASGMVSLTWGLREKAANSAGLGDWVTSAPRVPAAIAAPAVAAPRLLAPTSEVTVAGLRDWERMGSGVRGYDGSPISMMS